MIFDAFLFYNELDLLEIRLHELDSVVDRFVLVEATRTHSNLPKPLYYDENRDRFARFHAKIEHVVVEDTPDTSNAWTIERFQRNAITRALCDCRPDDFIVMSDVDEIPRAAALRAACASAPYSNGPLDRLLHRAARHRWVSTSLRSLFKKRHPFVTVLELLPCIYYFNLVCPDRRFRANRLVRYRDLGLPRDLRRWDGRVIPDAGWHFTCLGGVETVIEKIATFAHQEYNTAEFADRGRIAEAVARGEYVFSASAGEGRYVTVPLDSSFPAYILQNRERFARYIKAPSAA